MSSLLERLSERPIVSAHLVDLKTLTPEFERNKMEDVVGASGAAMVASEDRYSTCRDGESGNNEERDEGGKAGQRG